MMKRHIQMACVANVVLFVFFCSYTTATAAVTKTFEFDVDGIFPSSDPDIELFNNTGQAEFSLFSVSGGLLHQQTFGVGGSVGYFYPNVLFTGDLDPTLNTTVETRLRILNIDGRFGVDVSVFDGVHNYGIDFSSAGIHVNNWWGASGTPAITADSVNLDVYSFHIYRLDFDAVNEILDVSVDGNVVSSIAVPVGAFRGNGFEFGDGKTAVGNGANVEWDYVRVSQVPEPAAIALTTIGLLCLSKHRKRRTL